jgi:hypothetical protein
MRSKRLTKQTAAAGDAHPVELLRVVNAIVVAKDELHARRSGQFCANLAASVRVLPNRKKFQC